MTTSSTMATPSASSASPEPDRPPVSTMRRYGGDWQPLLGDFADAIAALALPDTAWAVLSCPIDGMDLDPDFVALIDRDADGRVRADDVRRALTWTASMLANWEGASSGDDFLRVGDLSALADPHRRTALALAHTLGHTEDPRLSLADLRDTEALCQCGDRDGDGVVPVSCLPSELQDAAHAILDVCPPQTDRNGKPGLTQGVLDQFVSARARILEWEAQLEQRTPWGPDSKRLAALVRQCDPAVSAWFTLSQLACSDPHAAAQLDQWPTSPGDGTGAGVEASPGQDPRALVALLDRLPLAPPAPDGRLRFDSVRPGTAQSALLELRNRLLQEVADVDAATWADLVSIATEISALWEAGADLDPTPHTAEHLRAIDEDTVERLRERCRLDEVNKQYLIHLEELERVLIYQRDLFTFCRNFIAFTDLMDPRQRALFERGTLVLGGREFHFAMRVRDIKQHKQRAEESSIFVLYAEVTFRRTPEDEAKLEIVAVPVTRGTSDGLRIHRRGVFVDRDGHYHEALVLDLVENPVSMTEALLAPFERVVQYISGKLDKFTQKLEGDFDKQVSDISKAAPATGAGAAQASNQSGLAGLNPLMGGTVAFAALGSAFAFVTKQLSDIGGPRILLALVVVSVLVAVPTVLMASVRLYRRNLAGLISASDWALNDQMRLTSSLGRLFTRRPRLPAEVHARTRDYALEQLKQVDPAAAWRQRLAMGIRVVTITTMTTLLLGLALPTERLPWLEVATWSAAIIHLGLLAAVSASYLLRRRFAPVYWWPVLTALPAALLLGLYVWFSGS